MSFTNWQKIWLLILRMAIGWQLLYEGLVKLANPDWSSARYLLDSQGFLKEFYYWLAGNPSMLEIIDLMNIWGLIILGAAIFLGLFTRVALIGGIVLLSLYYFSHPPFVGIKYAFPTGGSYLFVNNQLIEILVFAVLYMFPTQFEYGIDKFIFRGRRLK